MLFAQLNVTEVNVNADLEAAVECTDTAISDVIIEQHRLFYSCSYVVNICNKDNGQSENDKQLASDYSHFLLTQTFQLRLLTRPREVSRIMTIPLQAFVFPPKF